MHIKHCKCIIANIAMRGTSKCRNFNSKVWIKILSGQISIVSTHSVCQCKKKYYLALGKSREGAYTWDPNISIWRPLPISECHAISALSLAGKIRENNKVKHNSMTQIASLLVVAMVLLWHVYILQSKRGARGLIRETNYLCRNLS